MDIKLGFITIYNAGLLVVMVVMLAIAIVFNAVAMKITRSLKRKFRRRK